MNSFSVGDKVIIRYKSFTTLTEKPATVVRVTKTLVVVIPDGGTRERKFKRGYEVVPGGGVSHNTSIRKVE